MVDFRAQFIAICVLHLLAVASPGPDFAIVIRQSVRFGRRTAIWSSLGIGTGILVHTGYCLLGIAWLVKTSPLAFTIMKTMAVLYLAWLGIKAVRTKASAITSAFFSERADLLPPRRSAYLLGFFTNALNPKATLFFLSIFSLVIAPATPRLIQVGYGVWMAAVTALWFTLVSVFFTQERVRRSFLRLGPWFDRAMGLVLLALCIGVAVSTVKK